MSIEDYGFDLSSLPEEHKGIPARITAAYSGYFHFICDNGTGVARLKASTFREGNIPTTGDFVLLQWNAQGESRILQLLPRKSCFKRLDPSSSGKKAQILAANFDTVFFLMSLNQNFNVRRLERWLSLVPETGAQAVVLLTKADLCDNAEPFLQEALAVAGQVPVFVISSATGQGLEQLNPFVQPRKTLVFLGSSGVGKSTLVNTLAGDEWMPTLEVREWDDKGRHATTERELVMLPNGTMVIDTPGVRELGMWDAAENLARAFADIEKLAQHCRFGDCRHITEPGCAVIEAIKQGELTKERFEAYLRLKRETAAQKEKHSRSGVSHRFRK